jgi:radical SAM protein (TIGR01212 family)
MYNKFSEYLRKRYNKKVYKLPINIPSTCPNRDGKKGHKGCTFCGEEGAGFENLSNKLNINEQIILNKENLKKRYKPEKYIAYFQNFSNTYFPINIFSNFISEIIDDDIVAIYLSTRPDCITKEHLKFLKSVKDEKGYDIVIEYGLQSVNYNTLQKLERGHTLAEFIDAIIQTKEFDLETCAHYILDIPYDTTYDVIEGAKILSALKVNQVKCHSLYILENTKLCEQYYNNEIKPISLDEYIKRCILFLEYLSEDIVIQRLLGRAPKDRTVFCNWGKSWWKIQDEIVEKMSLDGTYQGKKCNYLNGKSCFD